MRVQNLLSAAREWLTTIDEDAPLINAARLLQSGTDILVVCDPEGTLRGVITKTAIVAQDQSMSKIRLPCASLQGDGSGCYGLRF
jgi:predicted transcriptional regulator